MDPQIKKQCRNILTFSMAIATNEFGTVSISSTATIYCRIESRNRILPVGAGIVEERTEHRCYLPETFPLNYNQACAAQYTLPFESEIRQVKTVAHMFDERGRLDYVELVF